MGSSAQRTLGLHGVALGQPTDFAMAIPSRIKRDLYTVLVGTSHQTPPGSWPLAWPCLRPLSCRREVLVMGRGLGCSGGKDEMRDRFLWP